MSGKLLREKLNKGERVFGTFLHWVTTPAIIDLFPSAGLDFVVCNTEHNALNLSDFMPR